MKKLSIGFAAFALLAMPFAAALPGQALAAGIAVGNAAIAETQLDTYSNFTVVDTNNPVSGNGLLNTFNYYAANTNPFKFVLVNPAGVVEWISNSITPTVGVDSYVPPSPVPVAAGWDLGVYFTESGTIPFQYNTGAPAEWTPNGSGAPALEATLAYESTSTFGNWVDRIYSFGATGVGLNCVPVGGATPVDYGEVPVTTAAVVATNGQTITGTVSAVGCDVGVYVGSGITGVTIAAKVSNAHYVGIYVDGGNAKVTDSTVSNVGDVPFSGDQYGWGIAYVTNGTTHIGATGEVAGTKVSLYQKAGIVTLGQGSNVTLSDDTVTGNGPAPYIAQNGVEFDSGANGSVTNSQISGNNCTDISASCGEDYFTQVQSTGILLDDAAPGVVVSGNKVSASDIGIWAGYDGQYGSSSEPESINNNSLQNNLGYGLIFDSINGTSTNNSFASDPVGLLVTDSSANSTVTSVNDQFVNDNVNSEALQMTGSSYNENLIVEASAWPFHLPSGPHAPHFPKW